MAYKHGKLARHGHILRISAIDLGAQVLGVKKRLASHPRVDKDTFPQPGLGDTGADSCNSTGRVSALDTRKAHAPSPPAVGIPPNPCVDVGVVHATGCNFDQHLSRAWLRSRPVDVVLERVEATVTGENKRPHRLGHVHRGSRSGKNLSPFSSNAQMGSSMSPVHAQNTQRGSSDVLRA